LPIIGLHLQIKHPVIRYLIVSLAFLGITALLAFKAPVHGDGKYEVDVSKSNIEWVGEKFTGEHSGDLSFKSGEIVMAGHGIAAASFVVDMTSIKCTDMEGERASDLESHLSDDDFFYTEKFPEASIAMVSAKQQPPDDSGNNFLLKANLTIKGITNEISFPLLLKLADNKVTLKAIVVFDRTKWGIHYKSKSVFDDLGDRFIYDDIRLNISLTANVAQLVD